jgi:purine-binding chemotaxis protein CheW
MEIRNLQEVNAQLQEKKERQDNINFKMVTFSLSGKDYGVDIMNIKEIAKADKFTYVPNAAGFVRGVYNLRGDIIPIIDLRYFFHLPVDKQPDGQENLLILHIEDRVYGTIVDKIDKVVGVNSSTIQPPHPIFGDINIKYISGVVEHQSDLYIILDVVRIFSPSQIEPSEDASGAFENPHGFRQVLDDVPADTTYMQQGYSDNDLSFIKDGLSALKKFYSGKINEKWVKSRLSDWSKSRSASNIQLKDENDANEYLMPFYSPFTGKFWSTDYAYTLKAMLPDLGSNNIQVWNPGCGKGLETFSLACILKLRYHEGHIKIWANDSDIMSIANAPNLVFNEDDVPDYCRTFLVKGRNGLSFNQSIKDSIVFEYHDVANGNTLPELDLVVTRDLLSFLPNARQDALLSEIGERLKKKGALMLGANEEMPAEGWNATSKEQVRIYIRNTD